MTMRSQFSLRAFSMIAWEAERLVAEARDQDGHRRPLWQAGVKHRYFRRLAEGKDHPDSHV